jgi:hypothetical protein
LTKLHIILTASAGVAAKLRTGSQLIPSKLTDKIGEQATRTLTDPGSIHITTLDYLIAVEYASY